MSDIECSSPKVAVVEFDDRQKASVAAALQALADQMTVVKQPPPPAESDEIIELLSDSEGDNGDDDSDCEIMGFLIENNSGDDSNDGKQFDFSMIKPMVKQEIKEEIAEPESEMQAHSTGAFVVSDSTNNMTKSLTWKETSFVNEVIENEPETELVASTVIDGNSAENRLQAVDEPHSTLNENLNVHENGGSNVDSIVGTLMIDLSNNLQSNQARNLPTYVTLTDITKAELKVEEVSVNNLAARPNPPGGSEETVSVYSEDLSNSNRNESNIFQTDLMEINEDAAEQFTIDLIDDDDDPDYIYESDEDSDNDEETKRIVIDLLESDDENENDDENEHVSAASYYKTRREGMACLMHYICPQCGKNCGKFSNYKAHTEGEHELGTIASLNLRTIIDKVGKLCYQCIECNEKLKLKSAYNQLQSHRITHLPHSDYLKCRLCEKRFTKKPNIRSHLKHTHAKISRQYLRKKGPEPALKFVTMSCPICRRVQSNRKTWWKHLEEQHDYIDKMKTQATDIGDGYITCNLCKDKTVERKLRKASIRQHMLSHEKYKSFKCTGCDTYTSYDLFRAFLHVRREHLNEEKRYQCAYCDEFFPTSRKRYVHYRDHHKCSIQACAVCEKEFFSTSLLVAHMNYYNHYKLK